jgi:DNA-binding transcriptional ArsR family regulator
MAAVKQRQTLQRTLAAVVSHPLRVRIFMALAERTASPIQLMHQFKLQSVSDVSYHVKKLEKLGMVEEVDSRPVRGSTEHFYRAIDRPFVSDEEWAKLDQGDREAFTRYILHRHVTDIAHAVDCGTFDSRVNRALLRFPMLVDEEGFAELNVIEEEGYNRRLEIQAKSAERMAKRERAKEDRGEIPVMSTTMLFETPGAPPVEDVDSGLSE